MQRAAGEGEERTIFVNPGLDLATFVNNLPPIDAGLRVVEKVMRLPLGLLMLRCSPLRCCTSYSRGCIEGLSAEFSVNYIQCPVD